MTDIDPLTIATIKQAEVALRILFGGLAATLAAVVLCIWADWRWLPTAVVPAGVAVVGVAMVQNVAAAYRSLEDR